jgi:hypothetical protein
MSKPAPKYASNVQQIYAAMVVERPELARFRLVPDGANGEEQCQIRRENGYPAPPTPEEMDFLFRDRGAELNQHCEIFACEFINALPKDYADRVMPVFYASALSRSGLTL